MSCDHLSLGFGYEDNSYFSKTFKAFSGMTPMEYRQSHQE
ncbi:MAG: AraC family transcriptional regulator [Prevotellaceae bacterium]|nr:AraC family transcriptional regulator [Prevotellaceae bacterium]